jgi:hypothetical protein
LLTLVAWRPDVATIWNLGQQKKMRLGIDLRNFQIVISTLLP